MTEVLKPHPDMSDYEAAAWTQLLEPAPTPTGSLA